MRHIDDSRRTNRINSMVLNKRMHGTYRINHIACFLQFSNKSGRFTHRTGHNNTRSILFSTNRCFAEKYCIRLPYWNPTLRLRDSLGSCDKAHHRHVSLRLPVQTQRIRFLSIYTRYIVQHTAIVTTSSIRQIMFQCIRLDGIQWNNLVCRIGSGSSQYRKTTIGRLCICARCSSVILNPMALINIIS